MGMFTSSKGDYDYTQDYSNFDSFIDKESVINGLHEVISDLRTELTQLKAEKSGEWVSVADRLPEPHVRVMIYTVNGLHLFDSVSINGNWKSERNEYVTHWQLLPLPPLKEEN